MTRRLPGRARHLFAAIGLIATFFATTAVAFANDPAIRIVSGADGKLIAFEATGFAQSQLESLVATDLKAGSGLRLFSVHIAAPGKPTDQPPMLGSYHWQGSALRFTPQFSIRAGLNYRAEFRPEATLVASDTPASANKYRENEYKGKVVRLDVAVPNEPEADPTTVSEIYPTANVLPENQLKFYLHFSAPMRQREAYQHLELLKADGTPVDLPFLELGEELWDRSGKRLTLLIDPGRIKRGVKPREDLGPAIENGQEYTLVVHSDWHDATGNPLAKTARKTFRASPAITTALDTKTWKISAPQTGSKQPVSINFPRPLDRALLERTLTVNGPQQAIVSGRVTISDAERRWEFHPDQAWSNGTYEIVVDTVLEDLAGNRIGQAFEVDQTGTVEKKVEVETISLSFKVE